MLALHTTITHFRIMFKNRNCQLLLCSSRILSRCRTQDNLHWPLLHFMGRFILMRFPPTTIENQYKVPVQYGCLSTCTHDVILFSHTRLLYSGPLPNQALSPYSVHWPFVWLQNRVSICCHGDGHFMLLQERKDCVNLFIAPPFNRSALLSCEGNLIWSDTW